MSRILLLSMSLLAFVTFGCTKSEEAQAQRRTGESKLMPSVRPTFEAEYLADQSSVKTLPARKISYAALDSFSAEEQPREEKKPEPRKESKKVARSAPPAPSGAARSAPPAGASGKGSFWQRVGMKAMMGGGRYGPPGAKPPASKEGEVEADSEESDESGDDNAPDESADEGGQDKPKDDTSEQTGD
jgi:hypothetical protein